MSLSQPPWVDLIRGYAGQNPLIVEHDSYRIAVVDDEIRISDRAGFWHTLTLTAGNDGAIALIDLASECYGIWNRAQAEPTETEPQLHVKDVPQLAHQLHRLRFDDAERERWRVPKLTADDFDRPEYVRLRTDTIAAVLNLDKRLPISEDGDVRQLLLSRRGRGMGWRKELLLDPPDGVKELQSHYGGPDIFLRLGWAFAHAPSKRGIDTYISALPDSGKDTLLQWLKRACGGEMVYRPLSDYLKAGSQRFTLLERDLCNHRLVFANEADKPESVRADFLTRLTSDTLPDERKGENPVERRRTGDLAFIGNGPPQVEQAPGIAARMRWAYEADWPEMPAELRRLATEDDDCADWLATVLLEHACKFRAGWTPDFSAGYAAAAAIRADMVAPETEALMQAGLVEAGPDQYVSADEIRTALETDGFTIPPRGRLLRYVTPISPRSERTRVMTEGWRGYVFWRLTWGTPGRN